MISQEENMPNPTRDVFQNLIDAVISGNGIRAIKEIRFLTGLGLAESKSLYDSLRITPLDSLKKECEELKARVESHSKHIITMGVELDRLQKEYFKVRDERDAYLKTIKHLVQRI